MRCETSFFSLTFYKKLLTRNWPIWAVWLIGWFAAMPVNLLNLRDTPELPQAAAGFANLPGGSSFLMAGMAIITAVGMFFYLFKDSAMNLMGALPLRREGLFASAYAAGFTILLLPLVLVTLVTAPVEAALGCLNLPALLQFLGGSALTALFWFSFATLCCVISGNGVAAAIFFAIFNFVVPLMSSLVSSVLETFLYGYTGLPAGILEAVAWCTPVDNLGRTGPGWWDMAAIYAGVGFLMLLAALGLHHIRRAERSGDLISFTALRYIFKVCVIVCGGLSLGLCFVMLFFPTRMDDLYLPLTFCCCTAAVLSAFVAEMLLKKSFRVWKTSWRWALVSALAFALVLAVPQFDLLGFETRIPAPTQVSSAVATFSGSTIRYDAPSASGLSYEGDSLALLAQLHTYAVEHREETSSSTRGEYYSFSLRYTLNNGAVLRRKYAFYTDPGSPLSRLVADTIAAGRITFQPSDSKPDDGEISWETDQYGSTNYLNSSDAAELLAAAMEDVAAGRYTYSPASGQDVRVTLRFGWSDGSRSTFYCSSGTTSANAAVARLFPNPPSAADFLAEETVSDS